MSSPGATLEARLVQVTEANDPRVADYRHVREGDLVGRRGVFVAEGEMVLRTLIERGRFPMRSVLLGRSRLAKLAPWLERLEPDVPIYVAEPAVLNAVAGFDKYKKALIIVDFGTATTFDYITPKGEYAGGSIAPGILISLDALFERASKLPRVELVQPKTLIAKNTVQAMQAGITYGYVSLVDGIIKRMKQEVRTDPLVIATGGLSSLIYKGSDTIDVVDEFLTLEGLRILYEKNKDHHKFK